MVANEWEGRVRGEIDFTAEEDAIIHDSFSLVGNALLDFGTQGARNWLRLNEAADAMQESIGDYYGYTLSRSLALREFERGIEEKQRIGLQNDIFKRPDCSNPLLNDAFLAGEEAAKLNWLVEQKFLMRLLKRSGPLNQTYLRQVLDATRYAHQRFSDRIEQEG